jgi:hypothetical protein
MLRMLVMEKEEGRRKKEGTTRILTRIHGLIIEQKSGVRSQESGVRRKREEVRGKKSVVSSY